MYLTFCAFQARKFNLNVNEISDHVFDDKGYQGSKHHHVMEIVWAVISSWNVACIKDFKQSYLHYHYTEQGLESFFTEELLRTW
jgi:hypothetical protein